MSLLQIIVSPLSVTTLIFIYSKCDLTKKKKQQQKNKTKQFTYPQYVVCIFAAVGIVEFVILVDDDKHDVDGNYINDGPHLALVNDHWNRKQSLS